MRKAVFLLGAFLLAMASTGAALSQVVRTTNPVLAEMAFPPTGAASAALAGRLASASLAQQLAGSRAAVNADALKDVRLPAGLEEMARDAYVREPLAVQALQVVALDSVSRQDDELSLKLLESSRKLSRRSTLSSMLLLDRYSRDGRDADSIRVLDEILRRRSGAHGDLLVGLAANVGQEELLPEYRRLLQGRPPWGDEFWRQLAQTPPGLANAAELRLIYARDGGKVDPEIDALLVSGLADSGRFNDAAQVAALLGIRPATSGELVANADFTREPKVPVFDWLIASSGDYGAEVDDGRLVMSAIGGARGELARQLVRLPAGRVNLRVRPAQVMAAAVRESLRVELICPGQDQSQNQLLYRGSLADGPAVIDPGGCRWAWLRLLVAIPEEGEGFDAALDQVSLTARR